MDVLHDVASYPHDFPLLVPSRGYEMPVAD
jgi:hypothetical protein